MTDLRKATAFVAAFYDVSEDDARANYADEIEAALKLAKQTDCYGDGNVYRGQRSRDSSTKTLHWRGLEEQEVLALADLFLYGDTNYNILRFARAIEDALEEKNT